MRRLRKELQAAARPSQMDVRVPGKHRENTEVRTGEAPCTGTRCAEHAEA